MKTLTLDKRVACIEYSTTILALDNETLKRCKNIIKLLENGKSFVDGNQVLSNEQYLEMINNRENEDKTKKIGRKRK